MIHDIPTVILDEILVITLEYPVEKKLQKERILQIIPLIKL